MFNQKNKPLWIIKDDGNLYLPARFDAHEKAHQIDSIFMKQFFLLFVIAGCGVIEFTFFYQLFSSFLYDAPFVRAVCIGAMLFAFEIVPVYLGINLSKINQGYNIQKFVIRGLIIVFAIAFIANVMLRIVTRDLVLPGEMAVSASQSLIGHVEKLSNQPSPIALPYAMFASLLPLITAVGCFIISYTMSNPLKSEMKKLDHAYLKITAEISSYEALLHEYESNSDYQNTMQKEDDAKFEALNQRRLNHREYLCNYVRERIAEYLGDNVSISHLSVAPEALPLFEEKGGK